jgi:hypothetical protein
VPVLAEQQRKPAQRRHARRHVVGELGPVPGRHDRVARGRRLVMPYRNVLPSAWLPARAKLLLDTEPVPPPGLGLANDSRGDLADAIQPKLLADLKRHWRAACCRSSGCCCIAAVGCGWGLGRRAGWPAAVWRGGMPGASRANRLPLRWLCGSGAVPAAPVSHSHRRGRQFARLCGGRGARRPITNDHDAGHASRY